MKHCDARGYLVGPGYPIPTDPRAHAVAAGPLIGCNHLKCSVCGEVVRNWPGLRLAVAPLAQAEKDELYVTASPDTSRYLTREGGGGLFRVYACKCSNTQVASAVDLDRGFIEFDSWACAGHPEA